MSTSSAANFSPLPFEPIGTNGFNPTDAVVAPDGSLLISIGGRGTRGAIYKVEYVGDGKAEHLLGKPLRTLDGCVPARGDHAPRRAHPFGIRGLHQRPFRIDASELGTHVRRDVDAVDLHAIEQAVDIDVDQPHVGHLHVRQVRALNPRVGQIDLSEPRAAQVGAFEVRHAVSVPDQTRPHHVEDRISRG